MYIHCLLYIFHIIWTIPGAVIYIQLGYHIIHIYMANMI